MSEKCGLCRRFVRSGLQCGICTKFFHLGVCSGEASGHCSEVLSWNCSMCSRNKLIEEQERLICALQVQLKNAEEELGRLRRGRGAGDWELAVGKKVARRRYSDSFTLQVANRFDQLSELSGDEPPVAVGVGSMQQTLAIRKPKIVERCNRKKKVLLLGSSHGRGVGQQLQEVLGSEYQVTSIVKPSAGLAQVTCNIGELCRNFSKEDQVVIVGGAGNSLDRDGEYDIGGDLERIATQTGGTNVHFVQLFQRHDRPRLNTAVRRINTRLEEALMTEGMGHIAVVPVETIQRSDFTRHGLHLNRYGKGRLAKLIGDSVVGGGGVTHGKIPVVVGVRAAPFLD